MIRTTTKFTVSRSNWPLAVPLVLLLAACSADSDAVADSEQVCEDGVRADDACTPWSTCPAGTSVAAAPSETADRTCAACPSGTFSTTLNATGCTPWSTCTPGSYVSAPGSAVADQQCTACAEGTYSSSPNAAACIAYGECAVGTAQAEGTTTSTSTCEACEAGTQCPGGSAPKQLCASGKAADTWDDDGDSTTACVLWTQCPPGTFVSAEGTAVTDRQCTTCPSGQSSTTPNAKSCVDPATPVGIVIGSSHGCAPFSDGSLRCWGSNAYGQLGDGTNVTKYAATAVPGLSGVVTADACQTGSCAVLADGTVRCWGLYGGAHVLLAPSAPLEGLSDVVELRAGSNHHCARLRGGTVRCWGGNAKGELGEGVATSTSVIVPVAVDGLSGVVKLTTGHRHSCALLGNGTVRCWGDNSKGQLGDGTTTQRNSPSPAIPGLSGVLDVAAGYVHTCAVLADRTVSCWGDNTNGGLGDGTTTDSLTPTVVTGLADVATLAAGNGFTCARLTDGTVSCWGNNNNGQLGDGTTTQRLAPVQVAIANVVEIAAYEYSYRTCARLADASLWCWGNNSSGALGDGTTTRRLTPTAVLF